MRPRASSTTTCAGAQPERPPTEPEASSASRKACEMNGLNRSPPASSVERPGGLAHASHAAASRAAIDEATRAVKVVEAMAGCGPDSAAPHHSMGFRATAKGGLLSPILRPLRATASTQVEFTLLFIEFRGVR